MAILLVASPAVFGQSKVIDSWIQSHNIEASTDSEVGDPLVAGSISRDTGNDDSFILGDWRNVFVEAEDVGVTKSLSNSGRRSVSTDNGTDANGTVRIFWDGSQAFTTDANGAPVSADPLRFSSTGTLDPNSEISFNLNENFFLLNCTGNDNTTLDSDLELSLLFGETDQETVNIEVHVFTDATNWSKATATQDDGDAKIFSFNFNSDFTAEGANGGADFDNVGAIVLSTSTTASAVDVAYSSPAVLGCGTDFADAPIRHDQVDLSRVSYRTEAETRARESFFDDGVEILTATNVFDPETREYRGPHHVIGGPFIGVSGDTAKIDADEDGQSSPGADGDDNDGNDDEAGVTLTSLGISDANNQDFQTCDGIAMDPAAGRENWYCAEVQVSNPTDQWAQVVGWIDFQGNGAFDNLCGTDGGTGSGSSGVVEYGADVDNPNNDFCERSSSTLIVGNTGLSNAAGSTCGDTPNSGDTLDQNGDFTGGNVPPGCEGTLVMTWDLSNVLDDLTLNETFSRFRISTDGFQSARGFGFFSNAGPSPFTYASDGEVEDHRIAENTLPVSISAFESRETRDGLEVKWSTVSETRNVGFYLWGYDGRELTLLTPEMIPSKTTDASNPQDYRHVVPADRAGGFEQLAITAVDTSGKEEMYGLHRVGQNYGRSDASTPIQWDAIRAQAEATLAGRGFRRHGSTWRSSDEDGKPVAADFRVVEAGMQRIDHQDLMAMGLDLRGVPTEQIAVTVNGEPVPRNVGMAGSGQSSLGRAHTSGDRFNSKSVIEFWGNEPAFPEARYVDELVYRVSVDQSSAVDASRASARKLDGSTTTYRENFEDSEDVVYNMMNPLEDPWAIVQLRDRSGQDSYTTSFEMPPLADDADDVELEVLLAGGNDLDTAPDHHVQVHVNGEMVEEKFFDGLNIQRIESELPADLLSEGTNSIEIRTPGGTESPLDVVYVESISLQAPTEARASGNRLVAHGYDPERNLVASRFLSQGQVGYAWNGEQLLQIPARYAGRGMIEVTPPADDGFELWISSGDALHRPEPVGAVGTNKLVDRSGDFLVIAHPAFLPASAEQSHPLNDFVDQRNAEGWDVELLDITEIQKHYGGGMAVPEAVRRYLTHADQRFDYEHVLLIGDDTYDYRDNLGMGSVSFVPTMYAATSKIAHTPSDGLMADLDGDGVADKAIGRWPVRTLDDLESIVYKTLDWEGSMEGLRNAVWVADMEDPNQMSFQSQANRLMDQLVDAGWVESEIDSVFLDNVGSPDAGRDQLFSLLEEGRAFTGFVGHGAPSMWTFDGLLVPNDLAGLDNVGLPTMISTSTCYTSYFVSPHSETVAHRWMNGYQVDGSGDPIPGARNGAVAIHGAATLSNYQQNEYVVSKVQQYQLDGMTLGKAVHQARHDAAERGLQDQVVNWGLLGDPTLTVD